MLDMLKDIIRNALSKPATRVKKRQPFDTFRGHIEFDVDKCIFCMRCMRECPSGCITVDRQEKTWELDPFECIICGVCADVCNKQAIKMVPEYRTPGEAKYVCKVEAPKEVA